MHGELPTAIELALPAWLADMARTDQVFSDDDARIAFAIELAHANVEHGGGGPFGAAIFDAEGKLNSVGVNQVIAQRCSLAHAEILALGLAQRRLQRFRLNESGERYTLATSAQPCCQCFGALIWAGIDALLIGARGEDVEALTEFDEGPLPSDWIAQLQQRGVRVARDLRRDEAREVLAEYTRRGGAHY
ncbi:MAG TPA: nucleoside deaminase [Rhodanobacteraceae bacterium]|nr:nucleoside deaminase [Rhodanobacteraceae bacterium]